VPAVVDHVSYSEKTGNISLLRDGSRSSPKSSRCRWRRASWPEVMGVVLVFWAYGSSILNKLFGG
jgi:hypothetical protein